jgi:hypothetical protein
MLVDKPMRSRAMILLFLLVLSGALQQPPAGYARQDSYPPPTQAQGLTPTPGAVEATATPAAYPSFIEPDFAVNTPAPIGVESGGVSPAVPGDAAAGQQITPEATSRGLVFLWLSFIATFLIFLVAVVGAIILFTRRNEN